MCVLRTVDGALELLAADLAVERAAAGLLVELDLDRLFVVAEEACEGRWKRFALGRDRGKISAKVPSRGRRWVGWSVWRTFFGPWGLLELLRLPIVFDVY